MLTKDQIKLIEDYQNSNLYHPLTCGNNRKDKNHLDNEGILKVNEEGLYCPYCNYKQVYIPEFILKQ